MNNYCVYKHTSPSGKIYIGITGQTPEKRWGHGVNYSYNIRFKNAITKYGWENFSHEILFSELTYEDACSKEIELIREFDSTNREKGYNVDLGGHSRQTGENNPLYGRKRDLKTVEKIAEKRRGKKWSDAMRKAREEYHKNHPPYNKGKQSTVETRIKLSISHMGQSRLHSEETKMKIRNSQKNARKVIRIDSVGDSVVYPSVSEAAREIGEKKCIKENIRQCCHGHRNTAYGYRWRFLEEE